MIDIFQYSNMYTCKPAIQRKIKDKSVSEECGAYVTHAGELQNLLGSVGDFTSSLSVRRFRMIGFPIPSWPILAILYSQLRPGITVHEWMETNEVRSRGIDVRRFVTFGIIKGFLRRVHRWPIHVDTVSGNARDSVRHRSKERARIGDIDEEPDLTLTSGLEALKVGEGTGMGAGRKDSMVTSGTTGTSAPGRNESNITLRTTVSTAGSLGTSPNFGGGIWRARSDSPLQGGFMQVTSMTGRQSGSQTANNPSGGTGTKSPGYFQPQTSILSSSVRSARGGNFISTSHNTSTSAPRAGGGPSSHNSNSNPGHTGFLNPGQRPVGHHRNSRDARARANGFKTPGSAIPQREQETNLHASMLGYLDGLHHADELQVKFKMGWTRLEEHLRKIAGLPEDLRGLSEEKREAAGRGDYGKVVVVLR